MKTSSGDGWLSANIVEIPTKYRRYLDHNGIVKVGSNVREEDVLVGKLIPKPGTETKKNSRKYVEMN